MSQLAAETEYEPKDFKANFSLGRASEPTTPPERNIWNEDSNGGRFDAFTSMYGAGRDRKDRYSSASLTSPPGLNRMSRSGSQVNSPPNGLVQQQNGASDKFQSS